MNTQQVATPFAARPSPFKLSKKHCAVIVVDMQNEFGAAGGMFDRAGIDIAPVRNVVAPTKAVLEAARLHDIPVIYLAMQHRPDLADMGNAESPHAMRHGRMGVGETVKTPDGLDNRVLVTGFWGVEIIPELAPKPGDVVVAKHRFSGFFETALHGILQAKGIKQLVVTGCTTSICVESTIRDAMFRDYQCCILEDCTAEPIGHGNSRSNHDASLLNIELLFGWVSDSKAFVEAMD